MRRLLFFVTISVLTISLAGVANTPNAKNEIKQSDTVNTQLKDFQILINQWIEAYNTNDTTKLKSFYSPDAKYISSHVSGLELTGGEKVIENFYKGVSMGGHVNTVTILAMNSSCKLTTLLCKYEATNNGQNAIGRNLLVLKLINGKWFIVIHMTVV